MHWGVTPKAMVGHSIGEYVAAHLAGVMSLEDALKVVAARGRLIQELPPGAMAAVHLPAAELQPRLEAGVEIAAINAPSLCTVSGPAENVAMIEATCGCWRRVQRALHTSHAFHSAMMEPALAPFTSLLSSIKLSLPTIPYVSNVTGTWITAEQATSPAYYAAHLRRPVQFEAGIRTLAVDHGLFFLEVGPGNALTTLARANLGGERAKHVTSSLSHPRRADRDSKAMLEAVGRLWLSGVPVSWPALANGSCPSAYSVAHLSVRAPAICRGARTRECRVRRARCWRRQHSKSDTYVDTDLDTARFAVGNGCCSAGSVAGAR